MSNRIVHLINGEMDVQIQRVTADTVRVRLTEKDPEIGDPTDFEIEGSSVYIAEALTSIATVLIHLEEVFHKVPS